MNTLTQMSLSDIRIMILCDFPLSTEEYGHLYYDGDGVIKNRDEAYVWYRVAQCAGNHKVDCLVNYLNSRIMKSTSNKLSSRAKHIYARALLH
jgi:TPR repeat protein